MRERVHRLVERLLRLTEGDEPGEPGAIVSVLRAGVLEGKRQCSDGSWSTSTTSEQLQPEWLQLPALRPPDTIRAVFDFRGGWICT